MISDANILRLVGLRISNAPGLPNWKRLTGCECQPAGFISAAPPVVVRLPVRTVKPGFFSVHINHVKPKGIPCSPSH